MRKLTILTLALLYVVSLAAVSAFAANAARVGDNQARMVPIESRWFPLIDGGTETSSTISGKSDASYNTALGYYMSPGHILGTTSYDLQHNMRMARQVAVGANGRVHFVWTSAPLPFDGGLRAVYYTSYNPTDGVFSPEAFSVSAQTEKTPGRFCTVDVFANRALAVNHYTVGAGWKTTSALDIGSGAGTFTAEDTPSDVVNCENIYAGSAFVPYIWPVAATDVDGTGKLLIHVAASEANTAAGFSAITYFRGVSSGATIDPGMYGTCGKFIDSCASTGYDIAADPYSNRVVIVYPIGRQDNRENNDLGYRLSSNLGVDWGPRVNVTNFPGLAKERCTGDLSVLFTADGFFHVIYVGNIYDSLAGTVSDQESKLWQWSSGNPTQRSLVLDANNSDANCNTPAFEYNISKVNLTQCFSTALNDTLLYATYSRQLGTTADPDCSDKEYFNQEVFISPSSTWGETWGAPVNLTNTKTNLCLPPTLNCADDGSTSSAKYVTDSLRIEYMEDLDAGSNVGNEGGTASLLNPIRFISYPCIAMADYRILTCTPNKIGYPFHAVRNASKTQDLVLVNGGNQTINWTASVILGSAWISLPLSGTVTAGYTNSATITATFGPIATEGLFKGTIRFSYDSPPKTFDVTVDFYVFDSWFLPQDVPLRTAHNRMMVNQAGQAANDVSKNSFSYFADLSEDFITDASLIMGNSAQNLSWLLFKGGSGGPTPSNNFGWLYALSNTTYDSTTFPSYRIASGKGTNRDSTVGFDVDWYAAKHVDSADFYVGHFEVYKGPNNPTGTVTGLTIAFGCDWDVPSDTSSDNSVGIDATRQMISLRGEYSAARQKGFGAVAAYREDGVAITGGFAFGNQQQVYAQGGLHVDSVWKYMQAITAPPNNYSSTWKDSIGDMTQVMVVARNYTVTSTSRLKFDVVLAGKRAQTNTAGLAGLNTTVDQAKAFICRYIAVGAPLCQAACISCGDANSSGTINISDAVFLIAYIFAGGTAPASCNYPFGMGDANGSGTVNISDAVYLIAYIFAGGTAPRCQ